MKTLFDSGLVGSSGLLLALIAAPSWSAPLPDSVSGGILAEVTVTAQKRTELLQDVPVPVTVINADSLLTNNLTRIQDLYTKSPGLQITANGPTNILTIRGITTGGGSNPTVGVLIDDVPVGSTTAVGSVNQAPDIDPSNLSQVEVLRGPQGTLYGASGIGGVLKYETKAPSMEGFSGRVQADTNTVHNADRLGYGFRAAVNVPVSDTFAFRASGFTHQDPGYIDVPQFHIKGVDQATVYGGFVSALWQPSAQWSLKLNALVQRSSADGVALHSVGTGSGELQQKLSFQGAGSYRQNIGLYSAVVKGDLGFADFQSITSYGVQKGDNVSDQTAGYGGLPSTTLYGPTATAAAIRGARRNYKFSQELRLSGAVSSQFDWLAGLFYTHEDAISHDHYVAIDPTTSNSVGFLFDDPYPTTFKEQAVFGDLTFHVTDRFDVQVGARESQSKQSYKETVSGPEWQEFGFPFTTVIAPEHTKNSSFTYLLTPSFKIEPNLMVYSRIASGYRPGGPNFTCFLFHVPCSYKPDKTVNYEVGVKGDALGHMLSFDASLYYIDWKDIQLQVINPETFIVYYTNGSKAKSEGIELSAELRPLDGLKIGAWVAYNDAELRQSLPVSVPVNANPVGSSGDRLPYASRVSGSFSVDQDFSLTEGATGFAGGTVSYIGDRKGVFQSAGIDRNVLPAYAQINLHMGMRRDSWSTNVYLNNLTDRRGELYNDGASGFHAISYVQPRTLGLSFSNDF